MKLAYWLRKKGLLEFRVKITGVVFLNIQIFIFQDTNVSFMQIT